MKLQTKLLLVTVPLIVLPLLALGWIGYIQLRDTATARTHMEMTTLLEQLSGNVQATLQTAQANVELFSRSLLLTRYMLTADESERYNLLQPTLLSRFRSYQRAYPSYYEIRVLMPDGYEDSRLTRGNIPNRTEDEGDTPYFRELQEVDGDRYSTYFRNADNQKVSLLVAKRLRLKDLSVAPIVAEPILRGYLAITVDLSFMEKQVKENGVGTSGSIFFTDDGGTILFHPKLSHLGLKLPPELFEAACCSAQQGSVFRVSYEGEDTLFEGRQLHERLFLFASLPNKELLAAGQRLGRLVAGITVIAIVITIALMVIFLKSFIVSRIQKLDGSIREIGRGNLRVPIDVQDHDEIGRLARSFQEMARNLAQSHERIHQLAFYDDLTGLPNRLMFREHLNHSKAHAARNGRSLALLFVDFDNFKAINDTLGHAVGDRFLKEMGCRISNALRGEDTMMRAPAAPTEDMVARLGGDEFLILLQDLNAPFDAGKVAGRILSSLSQPLMLAGYELRITGSIGITLYPEDGDEVDSLIKNADIAMYEAKQNGKNNYQYYSEPMRDVALQRATMETKLRRALENNQILLYYQPQLEVTTGSIIGFEALVRWQEADSGIINPNTFIPLAEETGFITSITAWVLKEACRQNKAWRDAGLGRWLMSVNVSGVDVNRANISEVVAEALEETGLEPDLLVTELTETSVMSAQEKAIQTLRDIKTLGVRIALDDFGIGYSSLNYLRQFPIDELKIDRSFLTNLPSNREDTTIVSTIIAIARSLGLTVTAEGVETEQQLGFLRTLGCDFVQGFLFSPAVAAQEVPELLRKLTARHRHTSLALPNT